MTLQSTYFAPTPPATPFDEEYLTKVLNTSLLSTRNEANATFLNELKEISRTPAFRSILQSIHRLSQDLNCTEKEAAEQLVTTFRRLDQIWSHYITAQGINQIKNLSR